MLNLEGPRLKLHRAEQHQACIERQVKTFLNGTPFSLESRFEPVTKTIILFGKIAKSPPPLWSVLVGEFAHNARSALDLMVYEAAPEQVRRGRRTGFPIYRKQEDYLREGRARIAWLPDEPREFIEAAQPFNRTDVPAKYDLLAVLAELNNVDKHQLIPVLNVAAGLSAVVSFDGIVRDVVMKIVNGGVIREDGAPVATIQADADEGVGLTVRPRFAMQVQFAEGTVLEQVPVPDLLREIHDRVSGLVEDFGQLFP